MQEHKSELKSRADKDPAFVASRSMMPVTQAPYRQWFG